MAFNPQQFKQKKKREVDPNAPPRPNLMSHDKTIREGQQAFTQLEDRVQKQAEEIARLKSDYANIQQSVAQILNYLRKGR
jgi:DNA-binding transcriptional regulator GbsR (MarR family)